MEGRSPDDGIGRNPPGLEVRRRDGDGWREGQADLRAFARFVAVFFVPADFAADFLAVGFAFFAGALFAGFFDAALLRPADLDVVRAGALPAAETSPPRPCLAASTLARSAAIRSTTVPVSPAGCSGCTTSRPSTFASISDWSASR